MSGRNCFQFLVRCNLKEGPLASLFYLLGCCGALHRVAEVKEWWMEEVEYGGRGGAWSAHASFGVGSEKWALWLQSVHSQVYYRVVWLLVLLGCTDAKSSIVDKWLKPLMTTLAFHMQALKSCSIFHPNFADASKMAWKMAKVFGCLPPLWNTRVTFMAPGFTLAQKPRAKHCSVLASKPAAERHLSLTLALSLSALFPPSLYLPFCHFAF